MKLLLFILSVRLIEPNDNERPTAIESATHAIPPSAPILLNEGESTGDESSSSADPPILPIIVPSFDESSARVVQTNEPLSTVTNESELSSSSSQETSEPTPAANQSEFVNPRGIRFTTTPTNTTSATPPVKGVTSSIQEAEKALRLL